MEPLRKVYDSDVVTLAHLKHNRIRGVQLTKHLQPLKKSFNLSLLSRQDKNTYVCAITNALYKHLSISFKC